MAVIFFILIHSVPYPSLNNSREKTAALSCKHHGSNVSYKLNVVIHFPVFACKPIGQIVRRLTRFQQHAF